MYCRYFFGMAQVCTPFTGKATSTIHDMIIRRGHLLRDASDEVRKKTVKIDFKGFEIEADIVFSSGSNHSFKIYLDPRGSTVSKIKRIRRWKRINGMMRFG